MTRLDLDTYTGAKDSLSLMDRLRDSLRQVRPTGTLVTVNQPRINRTCKEDTYSLLLVVGKTEHETDASDFTFTKKEKRPFVQLQLTHPTGWGSRFLDWAMDQPTLDTCFRHQVEKQLNKEDGFVNLTSSQKVWECQPGQKGGGRHYFEKERPLPPRFTTLDFIAPRGVIWRDIDLARNQDDTKDAIAADDAVNINLSWEEKGESLMNRLQSFASRGVTLTVSRPHWRFVSFSECKDKQRNDCFGLVVEATKSPDHLSHLTTENPFISAALSRYPGSTPQTTFSTVSELSDMFELILNAQDTTNPSNFTVDVFNSQEQSRVVNLADLLDPLKDADSGLTVSESNHQSRTRSMNMTIPSAVGLTEKDPAPPNGVFLYMMPSQDGLGVEYPITSPSSEQKRETIPTIPEWAK